MSNAISKRRKLKGRGSGSRFLGIPYAVYCHPDFANLPPIAVKLLIDILGEYNGYNNGDLNVVMSRLRHRGWRSSCQLQKAKNALLDARLIIETRQGGLHQCSLYGITWAKLDYCGGKLDINPDYVRPRNFKSSTSYTERVDHA